MRYTKVNKVHLRASLRELEISYNNQSDWRNIMNLSKPLVELQGLTKIYNGSKLAVNQMNLIIPRGRIIGLLGPNGSGKKIGRAHV